ncbi:MAG: cell division protein FtsL [Polyangiaceae bacterium]|nr:cell division protein FtsL [Polyangiaceae bacterium]
MSHHRPFLVLWVLAVTASVAAFVLHLAMRSKAMHLGYELGRARAEQARLREVRRVIELEVASYHTPQRVEVVARTLLHMEPPSPDRIIAMGPGPVAAASAEAPKARGAGQVHAMAARSAAPLPAPPAATELLAPRITPPKPAAAAPEAP